MSLKVRSIKMPPVKMPHMKLPTKNRWLWIALFVWAAILITVLATGWNVVLVSNYLRMLRVAHSLSIGEETVALAPWPIVISGTMGFVAAMGTIVLFFLRLLREMRLNQQQSEFLATVSHELKTPISSIELTSSLLRSGIRDGGISPAESEALWESQQRELKRLRGQVETILEAARWQSAPSRPKLVNINLDAWLNDVVARWQRIFGSEGNVIRQGEPLPSETWVDPNSLNLIIDNLLSNAKKFARGAPHVTIRTSQSVRRWKIEVQDEGWGFDPAESKRIFHRFSRSHHGAPYSIAGTGLGLYLASSACRALGLKLSATSHGYGHGATFTLEGKK
ncbi:MAG: HAMP domain-containing sensor histidine kinase [Oligoflexia bacterium]|nr:HAMP domain-containing sensor histidine kinase [Oligoflexia bacterium]